MGRALFALRVIITRIALDLSEQQAGLNPKEWTELVGHDCSKVARTLHIHTLI
jgi:hypothetical protein